MPIVSKPSTRKICMPPTRNSGRNTIATTMMPTPPSHCIKPRHKSNPFGSSSRPSITVEPVVVRPDMASKNASTKRSSVSPNIKGKAPNSGSASHTPVVSKKVCWMVNPSLTPFEQASATRPPTKPVIKALCKNAGQWPRASAISTRSGKSIASPSIMTKRPITYPTGRKSIIERRLGPKDLPCQASANA